MKYRRNPLMPYFSRSVGPPTGYAVSIDRASIGDTIDFRILFASGTEHEFRITDPTGVVVSGGGHFFGETIAIKGIDISSLSDGVCTVAVRLGQGGVFGNWTEAIFTNASAGFDPENLPLNFWVDFSDESTLTGSPDVTAIEDKVNAYSMSKTGAGQVQTGTQTKNSLNALDVVASARFDATGVALSEDVQSVFLISNVNTAGSSSAGAWAVNDGAGNYHDFAAGSGANFYGRVFAGANQGGNFDSWPPLVAYGGTWNLFNVVLDAQAGRLAVYVNGALKKERLGAISLPASATVRLFAHYLGNAYTQGQFGEFMIAADSSDEVRQQIEGYLMHKWGEESKLAADHPYKDSAP